MLSGVMIAGEGTLELRKGANIGLRDLDAELGSVTIVLERRGSKGRPVDGELRPGGEFRARFHVGV